MLTDVVSLAYALVAVWLSQRPVSLKKTYGYYRVEILSAFMNGILLWAVVIFVFYEAIQRIQRPADVQSLNMLIIAAFGLIANGLVAAVLSRSRNHSLNLKGAFLHVVADALGSVGAISAGLVMFFTGWYQADPIASIMIGVLVFYSSGKIVRDSVNVLLEGVPGNIDLSAVERRIRGMKGVKNLHDLHVWSIADTNTCCMSSHVVVEDETNGKELVTKLIDILNKEFGIDHTTIQIEDESYPKATHEH